MSYTQEQIEKMTTCPECGEKTLEFSQTADIPYKFIGGRLVPDLDEDSIGWTDATFLYCGHCAANQDDSQEIYDIMTQLYL